MQINSSPLNMPSIEAIAFAGDNQTVLAKYFPKSRLGSRDDRKLLSPENFI